jgi:outer membrane lipoprotein-sorting protein
MLGGGSMPRILLILALLGGGLTGALAQTAGDAVPGFFRAWLAVQKQAGDVRVEFDLTKTLPALKEPVKSSGRFWNYADGRFLWETGKPPSAVLRYDGVTLESWEAAANQWRKLDPNDRRLRVWMNFLSGQNLTEESLLRDFVVTVPAAEQPLAVMILEPRSKRERKDLKQLQLTFDPAERRLVRLVVSQGDGGTQRMDFGKPRRMTEADRTAVPPPGG